MMRIFKLEWSGGIVEVGFKALIFDKRLNTRINGLDEAEPV